MSIKNSVERQPEKFHGYWVLIGSILPSLLSGGAIISAFGVLLPVICDYLQWSRATAATALAFNMVAFGLPSPLYGMAVTRFGPRRCIIVGNIVAAMSLAGVFFVTEVWQFYGAYFLMGLGSGLGGYIACTTLINNWFRKIRSVAMGIQSSGAGIAGFIFPPLVTLLIASFVYKFTYLILGAIVFLGASIIAGVILVRNRPEDLGEYSDGINAEEVIQDNIPQTQKSGDNAETQLTDYMKSPSMWLIIAFVMANSVAMGTTVTHQVAYMTDIGFSAMVAASTMSAFAVAQLLGSILYGIMAMKFDLRRLTSGHFVIQVIAVVILLSTKNLSLLFLYSILMGFSIGALIAAMPTCIGAYFPQRMYARISGFILPFFLIAQAISAPVAGIIFDRTNSYQIAFTILLILACVGIVTSFSAKKPTLN